MSLPIRVAAAAALVAALAWSEDSVAAPIVSVDMDPSTPGVQSVLSVTQGSSFSVDIVISGVEPLSPLNAFNLTVSDGSTLVSATSATLGSFLLAPNVTLGPTIAGASATIGGATLLPAGAVGAGLLATVSFVADTVGSTTLALSSVTLSAPFGAPILGFSLQNGALTIESDSSLLSAPPTLALLLLGGLAALAARRRAVRG